MSMTIGFKSKIISFLVFFVATSVFSQESNQGSNEIPVPKKEETKLQEVISTDSVGSDELMKRAIRWIKEESKFYVKSSGTTTSNKVECSVIFAIVPKELNPQPDYTGKFTMNVVIECKSDRYRYTISKITHASKSGQANGGAIDNETPECGSMLMDPVMWKKLRGMAMKNAQKVASDIKASMSNPYVEIKKDDEW